MDLEISPADHADVEAPGYALLMATVSCFDCRLLTRTAALWVPTFVECDEDGERHPGDGPAVLHYVQGLDADTLAHVRDVAPWLRPASTQTSGMHYLAHHCESCGAVQGDYFVFCPDGPYFPQDEAGVAELRVVAGVSPLRARASAAMSSWMEMVPLPDQRR